jgi:hypothetical protein
LSSKNSGAAGFGGVKRSLFETWLSAQLEICDFGALPLALVEKSAAQELALDLDEVIRLLIATTRSGGRFRSDGEIITIR